MYSEGDLGNIESSYQTMAAFTIACNYNNRSDAKYKAISHLAVNPLILGKSGCCGDIVFYRVKKDEEGKELAHKWLNYEPVVIIEIEQGKDTLKLERYLLERQKFPTVKEAFLYRLDIDKEELKVIDNEFYKVEVTNNNNKIQTITTEDSYSQVLGLDLRELFDINTIL
ncbi:MAG: hypothetical protein NZ455_02475 [Bacteroidia bacterium]|nr:hypothetical protein [Bacteroidia bacterium]MDW8346393.1 hypothetical protein [Bacteroidia bacterium]